VTRRSKVIAAVVLVALAATFVVNVWPQHTDDGGQSAGAAPAPAKQASNAPKFDGAAAHELIRTQVAFGPRVPGTPGHEKQLAWMQEYLRARADTVIVQRFTHDASDGNRLRLANVFARFTPQARDRVLLVAHWDTRPNADQEPDRSLHAQPVPGANDGGSGVAVLMHLADLLKRNPPPIGVDILLVDGEDYTNDMYLGSDFFAANKPAGYQPLYGIVVDMVGDEDPAFPIEGYSQESAPEVVERVWRVAEELGYGNVFQRRQGGAISDDHVPLNRAGIRTIDIIDFNYGPGNSYWHTLQDTFEHTSPKGLGIVGTVLTELIYRGG
jgi:glutaminyl-peptide cyclotransferase